MRTWVRLHVVLLSLLLAIGAGTTGSADEVLPITVKLTLDAGSEYEIRQQAREAFNNFWRDQSDIRVTDEWPRCEMVLSLTPVAQSKGRVDRYLIQYSFLRYFSVADLLLPVPGPEECAAETKKRFEGFQNRWGRVVAMPDAGVDLIAPEALPNWVADMTHYFSGTVIQRERARLFDLKQYWRARVLVAKARIAAAMAELKHLQERFQTNATTASAPNWRSALDACEIRVANARAELQTVFKDAEQLNVPAEWLPEAEDLQR